jgi:ring-1,2-phenylacetyl-CoA epoxidase subunit PaaD
MNSKEEKINVIKEILSTVFDPEIPVLTVEDLGVIRGIEVNGKKVKIKLTPTYSGCPAMDTISADIQKALQSAGYEPSIEMVLSPAWTTDWISQNGRKKMEAYGIAPPMEPLPDKLALLNDQKIVKCTRCGSKNTRLISQFGSTACKALFQCEDCHEPFDYFKCLK